MSDAATTTVLALDPGKATGWALLTPYFEPAFVSGETDFAATGALLESVLDMYYFGTRELVIVSESFIITPETVKNSQSPWSLELIGVARYFSEVKMGKPLTLQTPAAAKRFASDARLKAMGWHAPGKGHANDAARHLLLYCATARILDNDTLEKLVNV